MPWRLRSRVPAGRAHAGQGPTPIIVREPPIGESPVGMVASTPMHVFTEYVSRTIVGA